MNALNHELQAWANTALAFVYPERCQICGDQRAIAREGYVCSQCWKKVRFIKPPFCRRCGLPYEGDLTTPFECQNCREMTFDFVSARSAVIARGVVLDVIHRYKYQRALWFEPFLADLLVREARPELALSDWDVIIPVPLHPTKEREREFNQAVRMSRHLGAAVGIPVQTDWLRRTVATRTQTLLTRRERTDNVCRAFTYCGPQRLRGERIVLIDDVFTTGATTNACAHALRGAGAGEVCVWTVARGL